MNRRTSAAFALLLCGLIVQVAEPTHAPVAIRAPVQDKNFFLLSVIERTPAVARVIESDAELSALRRVKASAAEWEQRRFSDAEISAAAAALRRLYDASKAVREMTDGEIRRSGVYVRYGVKSGGDLLGAALTDAAHGINNIIDVYGGGKAPRSPAIDAVSYDVKSEAYVRMLHTVTASLHEEEMPLFFQPSLRFALHLLDINHRDEAGRLEPLENGVNAAALRRIASIKWNAFPYSVIVVPGYGPDRPTWALAPEAKLRLEIAVRRYRQKKAPVILVSGGYVHPNQTQYCEAMEMKNALVAEFGIPADAILVDPHARHTTTNLRNAARLMYRYGIPFERTALITTDSYQSEYIAGDPFSKRCEQDLGYQPAKIIKRLSEFDLEFTPMLDSLQIDPMDALDP